MNSAIKNYLTLKLIESPQIERVLEEIGTLAREEQLEFLQTFSALPSVSDELKMKIHVYLWAIL
jgi:hypothetical protein